MPTLHVLRVFVGADGTFGNPLGVFLSGTEVPAEKRPAVAADLGFSETVFVLDPGQGVVEIRTPTVQLPFAGHPLVGTGWLLHEVGQTVDALRPPAGVVPTWSDNGEQWIRGRAEWAPVMELRQYPRGAEVDTLTGVSDGCRCLGLARPVGRPGAIPGVRRGRRHRRGRGDRSGRGPAGHRTRPAGGDPTGAWFAVVGPARSGRYRRGRWHRGAGRGTRLPADRLTGGTPGEFEP